MNRLTIFILLLLVGLALAAKKDRSMEWKEFKQKHKKNYKDDQEEKKRYEIFSEKADKIDAHNAEFKAGKKTFEVEINKFSDLTDEEMKQYKGLKPEPPPASAKRSLDPAYLRSLTKRDLPPSVDWRTKGILSQVKDQGGCGSCWAFTSTGAMEAYAAMAGKRDLLSEQNLVDCVYPTGGCKGGFYSAAWSYVKNNNGISTSSAYPYTASFSGSCNYKPEGVSSIKIVDWTWLPRYDEAALMAALVNGPVALAIDSTGLFSSYKNGVFLNPDCATDPMGVDHAVLAVGYGTSPEGIDYYIIKNSWGTGWGEDGYGFMARNKNNNCQIASWPIVPIVA